MFHFSWRQYFPETIGTSSNTSSFFHLMQIFNVDIDYPVLTLDAFDDKIMIKDFSGDKCKNHCPSAPIDWYTGTSIHELDIKFGPDGWIDYTILDRWTGDEILLYHGTGNLGGDRSVYVSHTHSFIVSQLKGLSD